MIKALSEFCISAISHIRIDVPLVFDEGIKEEGRNIVYVYDHLPVLDYSRKTKCFKENSLKTYYALRGLAETPQKFLTYDEYLDVLNDYTVYDLTEFRQNEEFRKLYERTGFAKITDFRDLESIRFNTRSGREKTFKLIQILRTLDYKFTIDLKFPVVFSEEDE